MSALYCLHVRLGELIFCNQLGSQSEYSPPFLQRWHQKGQQYRGRYFPASFKRSFIVLRNETYKGNCISANTVTGKKAANEIRPVVHFFLK